MISSISDKSLCTSRLKHLVFRNLITTLPPLEVTEESAPIRKAISIMCSKNYSQLPVIKDNVCIGSITSDSILLQLKKADQKGYNVNMDWPVKRFLDQNPPRFVKLDDDIINHVDWMANKSFVLIGSPQKLRGIVTNYDLVLFFKQKTEAFLLIGEIETAIRYVIVQTLSKQELGKALDALGKKDKIKINSLSDLTFDRLRQLILGQWTKLKVLFKNREQTDKQLQMIRNIRNEIFHFRKSIRASRLQDLRRLRDNYIKIALSIKNN